MDKIWKPIEVDEAATTALQEALGVHPIFCKALLRLGIRTFSEAKSFFRYSIKDLPNPLLMRDMRQAVERIDRALRTQEPVLIFGDYDVDGTTGVALLYRFLKKLGFQLDYYLPDRHKEGYGLSEAGILYAAEQDATLLIAVDCGIKAIEQVKFAKSLGIDIIICDHHLPFDHLPEAVAVLDPMRPDCPYPSKELSGAGVAFKLCEALTGHFGLDWENLHELLDLLCLSISCDIVPVMGENRILLAAGLEKLNKNPSTSIKALVRESSRVVPLSVSDVVYGIGPVINAAGRLGHARNAVKLLLNEDWKTAVKQAQYLVHQNRQRRILDAASTKDAAMLLESEAGYEYRHSAVLYSPDFHKGILGILAARIAELYNRPTVVLTDSDAGLTGSARSVQGFDLYESLEACSEFFEAFGGHHHAAGLRMKMENLEAFKARFEAVVSENIKEESLQVVFECLGEIRLPDITPQFMNLLRQFAPFGPQNRRPVFVARNIRFYRPPKFLKDDHVQLSLAEVDSNTPYSAIAFGLAPLFKSLEGRVFDICFTVKEDYWKGERRLKLHIKDAKTQSLV